MHSFAPGRPIRCLLAAVLFVAAPSIGNAIDFAHEVVPVLKEHCVKCHGGSEAKGGFSLNTRESFLESDAATPGDSSDSQFVELIRSTDPELQMPPKDHPRLTAEEIATLVKWVDADMPWTEAYTFSENAYRAPLLPREVTLPGNSDANPIDRLLAAYWAELGAPIPDPVDDATFVRRASMDLNGLLPTAEMVNGFDTDVSADKYAKLVDDLLSRDVDYTEHWLTFWNDLLRNDYAGTGFITGGRKQISGWLYRALIENKPFDEFTRELVAPQSDESRGFIDGIKWRGTVSAGQTNEIQFAQSVAQSFLGINLKCASCHDSFIDRWKLSDAYSLAAVYASKPLQIHRCDKPTGEPATAAWLFPELGEIDAAAPRDERLRQLAALMTDRKNGRYARTIVNRLWASLMGRGIVHPLDAMHTRPWNEDLLDYLAGYLVEHDYDLKAVLRLIATSQAYRSRSDSVSGGATASADYRYRGPKPKRMTAEQYIDAVWQLTGAAPIQFDAPVVRGKGTDQESTAGYSTEGEWIWGPSAREGKVPPGGEELVFRLQLDLSADVQAGVAVVTADNAFEMFVGKRKVAGSEDWTRLQTIPMSGLLKKGKNEIVVVARNFLKTPNLAGLFFEAHLTLTDDSSLRVATNDSWRVSATSPAGGREGRLGKISGPWERVVKLGNPAPYATIQSQARNSLQMALHGETAMVRASLLKSDFLMRSLGRPNRDQIVTSRPADLTTLEAIDLANGETLAAALATGASTISRRSDLTGEKLVRELFLAALSRPPSDGELETIIEVIGSQPTEQSIADVLWAICMMPEFVMVR